MSKVPRPPHLREADASDSGSSRRCETCKMFFHGKCWGYGNWPVGEDDVCDSYYPEKGRPASQAAMKRLSRQ